MKKCLVYLDHNDFQGAEGLLEVARQIYKAEAYEVYGVTFGAISELPEGFCDVIIGVDSSRIPDYDMKNMTNTLEEIYRFYQFDSILFPATQYGRMLAPRLAMRLHAGLVADVTGIRHRNDTVELIRPAFGGKLMACIVMKNRTPLMMSVNPNGFSYERTEQKQTKIIMHTPKCTDECGIEFLGSRAKEYEGDIRDSDILISGGGGIMRDFSLLNELADVMSAQVSASRKTVENGIAPRSIQVGQSGKAVSPRLYMALGINGSMQHMEGLKNAETIISVNTNKYAPILSVSDIAVIGDAKEFIVKLIHKIKENNGSIN